MTFDTDEIQRITSEACALFGLEVVPGGVGTDWNVQAMGCSIAITGRWAGSVSMGCGPVFAKRLASVMFEQDPEEMTSEEVDDAFGELVNVTAGNIKALLPDGCRMGLPELERDLTLDPGETARVQAWGFCADGDLLTIIIEKAA